MMKNKWIMRTIKNGCVKCYGKLYRPSDDYNGELDGKRLLFARYDHNPDLLYLATTKFNVINGFIYWMHWDAL